VLAMIGFGAARPVHPRYDHLALAVLPLLLAAHQVDEAFVWWGLQGQLSAEVGRVATWVYPLFAFVVLPVYVPMAVLALEPTGRRRAAIRAFVVSVVLLAAMLRGPVMAELGQYHVSYGTGLRAGPLVIAAYVVVTCGSLVFSGYRHLARFGVVNPGGGRRPRPAGGQRVRLSAVRVGGGHRRVDRDAAALR